MKSTKFIALYVVDNDPMFLEDFKTNFTYSRNYTLYTFTSVQKFLEKLRSQNDNNYKVVLINDLVISHGLNTKSVVEILPMIKNIDKSISVIVLTDHDNLEIKVSTSDLRPDAYIKKGRMLYLKIGPSLNRIISKYDLKKKYKIFKTVSIIAIPLLLLIIVHFVVAALMS